MAVLVIYKLDSNEDPVSTLHTGEHIFGRGALLKCDDHRVSRNHGIIAVNGESATITSTHHNPCFYLPANSSTITILPKNSPINVSDGDKFALLADQFWFRIKVEGANNVKTVENEVLEVTPGTGKSSDDMEDIDNASDNSIDFMQMPQKRAHEDDVEAADSKKLKSDGPPLEDEEEHQLLSVLGELKKTEVMSASEDEDNDVEIKPIDTPKQAVPKKGRATSSKKAKTAVSNGKPKSTVFNHDAELKSMLFSSDDEEEVKVVDKMQPINDTKINYNNIQDSRDDISTNNSSVDKEIKNNNITDNTDKKNDVKEENDQTDNTNPDVAGTSGTKKQWRDRCWYGLSCYRKNSKHLAEFKHPGDSDYESDPNDDRPMCAFGDSCYRRNRDHRQAYKHKNSPQKPTGKKTKKNNTGATTKKRTARQRYDESSEDEYDLEDPFLADSGSEYEADSGSDFDEDSESDSNGSGSEEETKRLLKEAKRFTKGKKKDKDDA